MVDTYEMDRDGQWLVSAFTNPDGTVGRARRLVEPSTAYLEGQTTSEEPPLADVRAAADPVDVAAALAAVEADGLVRRSVKDALALLAQVKR